MVFPVVATSATSLEDSSNVSSHTVSLPGSIASGDLLIVFFCTDGNPTITFPNEGTDWIEIYDRTAVSNAARIKAAWRKAGASEPSTITVTTSNNQRSSHIALRITGAEDPTTTAPETGGFGGGNNDSPNVASWSVSGAAKDYLWIASEGHDRNRTVDSFPSTHTDNNLSSVGGGANSSGCGVATLEANKTTDDPAVFTISASDEWAAAGIAVHPTGVTTVALVGSLAAVSNTPASQLEVSMKLKGGSVTGVSNVPDALMKTAMDLFSVAIVGQSDVPVAVLSRSIKLVSVPIAGLTTVDGVIGVFKMLAGSVNAFSVVDTGGTGSLLKVNRKLFGASDGISNLPDALMKVSMKLVSVTIIGQSDVPTNVLRRTRKLVSVTIVGQSTAAGVVKINKMLVGSLAAVSNTPDALLKTDMKLFGTSDGVSNTPDALLKMSRKLVSVTIVGQSVTATPNLKMNRKLFGTSDGVSNVPAALIKMTMKLFGTSDGVSNVPDAVLTVIVPGQDVFLIGSLAAFSGVTGYLRDVEKLPLSINIADPRIFIIPQSAEEDLIAKTMNPKVIIVDRK